MIMKNFKEFLLIEARYKTITKQEAETQRITWYDSAESITIYTAPSNPNEISASFNNAWRMIKVGITKDAQVFFWKGSTLHATVEQLTGMEFLFKLNLNMSNNFYTISPDSTDLIAKTKYYVENDNYKPHFQNLQKIFPTIQKIKDFDNTTYWLEVYEENQK